MVVVVVAVHKAEVAHPPIQVPNLLVCLIGRMGQLLFGDRRSPFLHKNHS